jgi:hypothetical protein
MGGGAQLPHVRRPSLTLTSTLPLTLTSTLALALALALTNLNPNPTPTPNQVRGLPLRRRHHGLLPLPRPERAPP